LNVRPLLFLIFSTLVALAPAARAELVLVASPHSGIERLTQDEVVNIYLGRYRRLASGLAAEPLDHPVDSEVRARFYRHLVGKSLAEINAYWARLVFSGKTKPPQVVANAEEMLRIVATQPGALAYVERSQADARVKIVFEFGD
jgi:ABC-type phosphate transport system substrate-binding protein